MIRDTITMARKEWLEILDQFIHFKRGGWSVIVVIIFLGIFVPLQLGPGWANLSLMFFYWPFLTASMTSTIVSDAVAGERERHTLETLLSTRLPDTSILLGKLLAAVAYGYAFALTNLLIGYITVKARYGPLAETMSASRFAALFVLIGAASSCIAGVGVSVSLRAANRGRRSRRSYRARTDDDATRGGNCLRGIAAAAGDPCHRVRRGGLPGGQRVRGWR
jgi:ABC-2 type transport system permease protein